jgi:hypothetical protein
MIDPHVLHGGASSWFRIAANADFAGVTATGAGTATAGSAATALAAAE